MKSFYIIATSLLLLIIFNGCGGKKTKPPVYEKHTLPEWYLTPPRNNSEYLYGIGEGTNRDEAVKQALVDMTSKFGITVASHYESSSSYSQHYREYYSKTVQQDLQSEVGSVRISNYETLEVQKIRYNRYIALVRSEKAGFVRGLVDSLDKQAKKLKAHEKQVLNSDVISRYNFYAEAVRKLEGTFSTLIILNTLSGTFDDRPYLQLVAEMHKKFLALKNAMTFSINGDHDSSGFMEVIRTALTDRQIKITAAEDKNHLSVYLSTSINSSVSYGFNIAKTVLLVTVKDYHGKIVGGNRLNINGQATQGDAAALENASKKLQDIIKKEGLAKILGVKLEF
jgi:hypothetical protein